MGDATNGHRTMVPRNGLAARRGEPGLRLGLNVPNGWWPVAPLAKSFEAAGLCWVQVHTPPREVLCDAARAAGHAARLRAALDVSGLALVLHAPDDLSAGTPEHDRALDGLIGYAAATHARVVVYHGVNFRVVDGGHGADRTAVRAGREVDSLGARLSQIGDAGFTLAIENLAPVWPGPPRLCHSPERVRELVRRLASRHVGMTFDVGHAHITADALGGTLTSSLEAVREDVVLFHVHDNLGARHVDGGRAGLDPLRLDLHLAPGAGTVPWDAVAPLLHDHPAPVLLEVHPPHRPEPLSLATVTSELLRAPAGPRGVQSARGQPLRTPTPAGVHEPRIHGRR